MMDKMTEGEEEMRIWTYLGLLLVFFGIYHMVSEPEPVQEVLAIPDQAIRLRILANSDTAEDQHVKHLVRDAVVQEIKSWVHRPKTIEEARKQIKAHLPKFQQIAEQVVRKHGYSYPVKVDFGQVPFPTKVYGNHVYPAGNYEAVRITLGEGKGGNWWCVLFPPLCFIDMGTGEAIPEQKTTMLSASLATDRPVVLKQPKEKETVEVRFFLLDKISELAEEIF
jgi:stage II sporulation protein R